MADKKEITEQKIFVKLSDFVHLQNEIIRLSKNSPSGTVKSYVNGMVQALRILGLPIDK